MKSFKFRGSVMYEECPILMEHRTTSVARGGYRILVIVVYSLYLCLNFARTKLDKKENVFLLFKTFMLGRLIYNTSVYELLRATIPFLLELYIVKSVTRNATCKQTKHVLVV